VGSADPASPAEVRMREHPADIDRASVGAEA